MSPMKSLEGRTSFLKKRSKKLLPIASGNLLNAAARTPAAMDKSFLLLFFKKEESFLIPLAASKPG
jgi:hypothetical protein